MTILLITIIFFTLKILYYVHVPFIIRWGIINKFRLKPWSAVLITTITGYIIGNICTDIKMEQKAFITNSFTFEDPTSLQLLIATSGGANMFFWVYLGWIASLIYAFLWLWFMRYLRK